MDPSPVTCIGSPAAANTPPNASRSRSPRVLVAARASSSRAYRSVAIAAAVETTLLLKVPAWASSPPAARSRCRMTSSRPPKAPNDIPPPRYLPSVVMSGTTPYRCWAPPVDSRDVMTSSRIMTTPDSLHRRRSSASHAGAATRQPPDPCTASTITQPRSVSPNSTSSPALSSNGARTNRCGTVIADGPWSNDRTPPWYPPSNTPTPDHPVWCSAVAIAMRLALVPELVNRTRSIDGNRARTSSASSTSRGCIAPIAHPPSSASSHDMAIG